MNLKRERSAAQGVALLTQFKKMMIPRATILISLERSTKTDLEEAVLCRDSNLVLIILQK